MNYRLWPLEMEYFFMGCLARALIDRKNISSGLKVNRESIQGKESPFPTSYP